MNGKVLDLVLIVALAVVFLGFAVFHPGIGNAIVAWVGLIGLGYYNSYIRHNPSLDRGVLGGHEPTPPHETLRPAWR